MGMGKSEPGPTVSTDELLRPKVQNIYPYVCLDISKVWFVYMYAGLCVCLSSLLGPALWLQEVSCTTSEHKALGSYHIHVRTDSIDKRNST